MDKFYVMCTNNIPWYYFELDPNINKIIVYHLVVV